MTPLFEWDGRRLLPGGRGLSDEQVAALSLDRNVVVRAGAGSGKTRTLARRCVRILGLFAWEAAEGAASPSGPESLLVSTFTEKAAAEMRSRIRAELKSAVRDLDTWRDQYEELVGPARFDGLRRALRRSLERFDRARISTFHGFCAATLREAASSAGLDPGFVIVQGAAARTLRADAVSAALHDADTAPDPDIQALLSALGTRRATEAVESWVDRRVELAGFPGELARSDDELLAEFAERFGRWDRDADLAALRGGVSSALHALQAFYAELQADPPARADVAQTLAVLATPCPAGLIEAAEWARAALAPLRVKGVFRKAAWAWIGTKAELGKGNPGKAKTAWTAARDELVAAFGEDAAALDTLPGLVDRAALPLLRGLCQVGVDAVSRYQRAKAADHLLDFDDLPVRLSVLLDRDARFAARLRRRIRHVLVDEFQDTNDLQWELVKQLRGDPLPESGLFLVGDLKQAIYRFRGGDVTVFDGALEHLQPLDPVVQPFADNWRSRPALIDALNDLFGWLLAPDTAQRPAWEAPFEALNPRRPAAAVPAVEVVELAEGDPSEDALFELLPLAREAAVVARLLHERLPDLPRHEGLQAAILLRRRTWLPVFARALREAGVDHVVASGRGFFGRQEVLDVANLLAALAHEDDVIALLGALRGPLLGLEDAWLLWLARSGRRAGPRALRAGWRGVLQGLDQPEGADPDWFELPPEGRRRIREAATRYRRWDRLARRIPLSQFLRTILDESAAAHLLALEDPTGQAAANLDKLVSLAVAFDREGGEGLAGFALHLQQQADAGADEGDAALDATAPVVLMTIHQSKGLEFPAVFLPDLGARIRHGGGGTLLVGRPPGEEVWLPGLKAPVVTEGERTEEASLLRSLVATRDRAEEYAESRRVLYVAATRAREQLTFVLQPPANDKEPRGREDSTSWAEWLRSWWAEAGPVDGVTWRDGEPTGAVGVDPGPGAVALPPNLGALLAPLPRRTDRSLSPHALVDEDLIPPGAAEHPAPSDPRELARLRGVVLHGCLEDGLHQPSLTTDRRARRALAEVGRLDGDHFEWMRRELAEHLAGFRRAAPPELLAESSADAVFHEIPFRLRLPDGRWLDGIIDALVRDAEHRCWRVIDYKTNRGDPGPLAVHYRPQLIAYAWAAARILPDVRDDGWTLTAELVFTASGQRIEVFADATGRSLDASLAAVVATQDG